MIQNLFGDEDDRTGSSQEQKRLESSATGLSDQDSINAGEFSDKAPFAASIAEPASFAETTRRDGLAWSAGIAFFASVVFMLILGWGADLLLGSSPWGIVGGIVIGSVIGFVQLFRLSSQIFKK